jgi:hypothetical protein
MHSQRKRFRIWYWRFWHSLQFLNVRLMLLNIWVSLLAALAMVMILNRG